MRRRAFHLGTGALGLAAGLAVFVIGTQVFPYHSVNHDEAVYLQQAAMLLEGQLNLWPPMTDGFRPWFFVEDGERLYPKYSPVPAALFALGQLVGGYRVALVGIAAANVVLVVAVVAESFDRPTGLVAGLFVLASPLFLVDSSVFLPYAPTTLLNLLFAYGYLRADRTRDRRWAIAGGSALVLAVFSRPYTALLFAIPFVGHALWTLSVDWPDALGRQATFAVAGLLGVAITLGYNAVMTGSVWLFPYEAFAPADGVGFGHRELLGHGVAYTPALAVRANRVLVELFFTEWIAGGLLGASLAAVGLAHAIRARRSPRVGVLVGLVVSVLVGNLYFWGNLNVLGDLDRAGDGLVSALGPYYHFDLLLPTAAFAAVGAVWAGRGLSRWLRGRLNEPQTRVALGVVLVVSGAVVGTVTAAALDERVERNMAATATYEDAYEPFEGGPPDHSIVLVPDPYGDWLNHPFQPLRNEPGFDGRAVYALDDHPFAVVEAFPDRRAYRFVYRGRWAPTAGSPEEARLQRIREVAGSTVHLGTSVGIPTGAVGVTARVTTEEGSVYYVAPNVSERLDLDLAIGEEQVHVDGDLRPVGDERLPIDGRDDVRVTIFVDYGGGGGFAYRLDLPVAVADGQVRALTPRIERCRNPRACGGEAAYVPESTPEGVFVRTELAAGPPDR